ncbi:pyridoxal phosphate-dependent decarboxylase [Suillus subluteus]|nr:pyridoxal phosphate-dependent decarboxylase [Suillus subluteus]
MDWTAQILRLDKSFYNTTEVGGGVIQTSASDSALIAAVAACLRYICEHPHVAMEKLVLYTTTQTHLLGKKAGLVLGLKVCALEVTSEDDFALRGEMLEVALREDVDDGLYPFILIATIGTTSSATVDQLSEIADIGANTDHILASLDESSYLHTETYPFLWLHVNAAWAGITLVHPEYHKVCQLPTVNAYADSFCTNFHKVCSCLIMSA